MSSFHFLLWTWAVADIAWAVGEQANLHISWRNALNEILRLASLPGAWATGTPGTCKTLAIIARNSLLSWSTRTRLTSYVVFNLQHPDQILVLTDLKLHSGDIVRSSLMKGRSEGSFRRPFESWRR